MTGHRGRNRESERGAILIHVAVMVLVLIAFYTFIVDYGVMWVARRQAQNAADAGALAGAVAMAFDNDGWTNRSHSGPAKQAAHRMATVNAVWGEAPDVDITTDVTFTSNPAAQCPGTPTPCIRVDVYRNQQRGNPLPVVFGSIVGLVAQGVRATATARVAVATTSTCIRPIAIPDRWLDTVDTTVPIDNAWTDDDEFDTQTAGGTPLPNPDLYSAPDSYSTGTGFTVAADLGTRLVLRHGSPGVPVRPGFYLPVRMPDRAGGNDYLMNWAACNGVPVSIGDALENEPGNVASVTAAAANDLIAQDSGAYWDGAGVSGSCAQAEVPCAADSPRIVALPVYDTAFFWHYSRSGGEPHLRVVNILGFFIEQVQGSEVAGRIVPVPGLRLDNETIDPRASFLSQIQLVR